MNPFICMVVMILMHKLHVQVINSVAGLYNGVSVLPNEDIHESIHMYGCDDTHV